MSDPANLDYLFHHNFENHLAGLRHVTASMETGGEFPPEIVLKSLKKIISQLPGYFRDWSAIKIQPLSKAHIDLITWHLQDNLKRHSKDPKATFKRTNKTKRLILETQQTAANLNQDDIKYWPEPFYGTGNNGLGLTVINNICQKNGGELKITLELPILKIQVFLPQT